MGKLAKIDLRPRRREVFVKYVPASRILADPTGSGPQFTCSRTRGTGPATTLRHRGFDCLTIAHMRYVCQSHSTCSAAALSAAAFGFVATLLASHSLAIMYGSLLTGHSLCPQLVLFSICESVTIFPLKTLGLLSSDTDYRFAIRSSFRYSLHNLSF